MLWWLIAAATAWGAWRAWRWLDALGVPVARRLAWGQIALGGGLLAAGLAAPAALKTALLPLAVMLGAAGLRRLADAPPTGTRPAGAGGRPHRAASADLDMTLDAEAGTIDGVILTGPRAGRRLSRLALDELLAFAAELDDPKSLTLLRSYLDAAHPGWERASPPPRPDRPMTRAEALSVLGLDEGAAADAVREAHRRLMKRVHPDAGGSAELAERVNRARDVLLG